MKLVNIKTLMYAGNPKDLLKCKLCKITEPQYNASDNNWVKDVDKNETYYCPECEKFLVNKLDSCSE